QIGGDVPAPAVLEPEPRAALQEHLDGARVVLLPDRTLLDLREARLVEDAPDDRARQGADGAIAAQRFRGAASAHDDLHAAIVLPDRDHRRAVANRHAPGELRRQAIGGHVDAIA